MMTLFNLEGTLGWAKKINGRKNGMGWDEERARLPRCELFQNKETEKNFAGRHLLL